MFAGHGDWRLPQIQELQTIVDGSVSDPAIDAVAFPNTPASRFWSASADANYSTFAWIVDFSVGYAYSYRKGSYQVRLVRAGQALDYFPLTVSMSGAGSGAVVSSPFGINCGSVCRAFLASGTSVTLIATADSDSTFSGWSGGGCSGTGICVVSLNQARSVTATFVTYTYTHLLSVTKDGTGSGTVSGGYINCGTACSVNYPNGTSVVLTATAAAGSTFASWSGGDCSFNTGSCTVKMNQARTVTAVFAATTSGSGSYTLTVTKAGAGSGTVNSSYMSCSTVCSVSIVSNSIVTLTATAATGSTFTGWSGGGCSGTGTCTVSMNWTQNVTAAFAVVPVNSYALTLVKVGFGRHTRGPGSGTVVSSPEGINCGALCKAYIPSGNSVTLIATANSNQSLSTFTGWSGGGCSGTGTCTVTMNQTQNVFALFDIYDSGLTVMEPPPTPLFVTKSGTGSGTVSSGWNIFCGTICAGGFLSGISVMLEATPDAGSTFTGWSGAGCSGTGDCTVILSQAQTVNASFTASNVGYTLFVNKSGAGSGTVGSSSSTLLCGTTCSAVFASGTSVTLTAAANAGSTFTGWTGAGCSGVGACTVQMTQQQNVTAAFALVAGPVCTLTALPATIRAGDSSTLTATCSPLATFYSWTGGTCTGTTAASCTVNPVATTSYSVIGSNSFGSSFAASALVKIRAVDLTPILMLLLD